MNDEDTLAAWPTKDFSVTIPLRYHLSGPTEHGLVICLHGYQDHALSFAKRLGWWRNVALPFGVLSINAPFPVPFKTNGGFSEAYAWYFRDATRGIEVGSAESIARAVADLVRTLGLEATNAVTCGFSQGGFLAPVVARHLSRSRAVICIGGGYPPELYAPIRHLGVFGIHGTADEVIPFEGARAAHAAVLAAGNPGEFIMVPDLTHRVTPTLEPLVRRFAENALA